MILLDWSHCPGGSLASKSPYPIFLEQASPCPLCFSLSPVQTYKSLALIEQVFLVVSATGGSRTFPQPCVGSSLQLSQPARAHLHRVLSTAVELVVKSEKLSPRGKASLPKHPGTVSQQNPKWGHCMQLSAAHPHRCSDSQRGRSWAPSRS